MKYNIFKIKAETISQPNTLVELNSLLNLGKELSYH